MMILLLPFLLFCSLISAEINFPSGPFKKSFEEGLKFAATIDEILNTSPTQRKIVEENLRSLLNCENKQKYNKLDDYILHIPSGFGTIGKSLDQVKKDAENLGVALEGLDYVHRFYCRYGNRTHGPEGEYRFKPTEHGNQLFGYVHDSMEKFARMYDKILREAPQEELIVHALVDKYMTCVLTGPEMCEQVMGNFGAGMGTYLKPEEEICTMYEQAGIICSMLQGVAKYRPCNKG